MDNQQAKHYLSAYRPGGQDAANPGLQEALRQAGQDPVLHAWFRKEQALDAAVAEKLRAVRPPAGLKEEILAGQKLARRSRWWGSVARWPLAAAAVLAAGAFLFWHPWRASGPAPLMVEFRRDVSGVVAGGFVPDRFVQGAAQAGQWLASQQAPVTASLPGFLKDSQNYACKVLAWKGTKATMMCFTTRQGPVHLFIVDLKVLSGQASNWKDGEERLQGLPTLAWTDRGQAYVLVAENPKIQWADLIGNGPG
jgi:hypothetical protein